MYLLENLKNERKEEQEGEVCKGKERVKEENQDQETGEREGWEG